LIVFLLSRSYLKHVDDASTWQYHDWLWSLLHFLIITFLQRTLKWSKIWWQLLMHLCRSHFSIVSLKL
jgi:hypothetical protein